MQVVDEITTDDVRLLVRGIEDGHSTAFESVHDRFDIVAIRLAYDTASVNRGSTMGVDDD